MSAVEIQDSDLRQMSKRFCDLFEHCSDCPIGTGIDECILYFLSNTQCKPIEDLVAAFTYLQDKGKI